MAKAKIAKKSTFIDMTPMVDLAFLLITFFMLTIKFTNAEAEQVTIPSSTTKKAIPAKDMLTVYGNSEGKVRVGITEQGELAKDWLVRIGERYNIKFTEKQKKKFGVLAEIPVPVEQLGAYLDGDSEQRKKIYEKFNGLPMDSTDNQLKKCIFSARQVKGEFYSKHPDKGYKKTFVIAVKADKDMPYPVFQEITQTLKDQGANKFSLITNKEGGK